MVAFRAPQCPFSAYREAPNEVVNSGRSARGSDLQVLLRATALLATGYRLFAEWA